MKRSIWLASLTLLFGLILAVVGNYFFHIPVYSWAGVIFGVFKGLTIKGAIAWVILQLGKTIIITLRQIGFLMIKIGAPKEKRLQFRRYIRFQKDRARRSRNWFVSHSKRVVGEKTAFAIGILLSVAFGIIGFFVFGGFIIYVFGWGRISKWLLLITSPLWKPAQTFIFKQAIYYKIKFFFGRFRNWISEERIQLLKMLKIKYLKSMVIIRNAFWEKRRNKKDSPEQTSTNSTEE